MSNNEILLRADKAQVISEIGSSIRRNNSSMDDWDLANFIYSLYTYRTRNHIALVNMVASMIEEAFLNAKFVHNDYQWFLDQCLKHDEDKLQNDPKTLACQAVMSIKKYNEEADKLYEPSEYCKVTYETKVIPAHIQRNLHHPECWAHHPRNYTGIPIIMNEVALGVEPFDNEEPKRKEREGFAIIAEMLCDWAAVGIEKKSTTPRQWFDMWYGKRWETSDTLKNNWIYPICDVIEKNIKNKEFGLPYDYRNLAWPIPKPVEPPKLEGNVESFCTVGVTESSGSVEAMNNTGMLFSVEVADALKKFESFEYKCCFADGSLHDDGDGHDIVVQSSDMYNERKAGMCHDATVSLATACKYGHCDFVCVYAASHDAPHYTTHSWVVVKNKLGFWSILDVYAKKHGYYKQSFDSMEEAVTARMKLWIKLDNKGSDNADVFIRKDCPKGGIMMTEWTTQFVNGARHFTAWKNSSIPEVSNEDLTGSYEFLSDEEIGIEVSEEGSTWFGRQWLFHISNENVNTLHLEPRHEQEGGEPHICFARSITKCLFSSTQSKKDKVYVYGLDLSDWTPQEKTKYIRKPDRSKSDFYYTGEIWVLKPVDLPQLFVIDPRGGDSSLSGRDRLHTVWNKDSKNTNKNGDPIIQRVDANKVTESSNPSSRNGYVDSRTGEPVYATERASFAKWRIVKITASASTLGLALYAKLKMMMTKAKWDDEERRKKMMESSKEAIVTPTHTTVVISPTEVIDIPRGESKQTSDGAKIYCDPATGEPVVIEQGSNEGVKENNLKDITFPPSEIDTLKKQDKIITTRVSADYDKFMKGDIVKVPWDDTFIVSERLLINNIKDHPFYNELTKQQIAYLSKFDKIAVLTLVKK